MTAIGGVDVIRAIDASRSESIERQAQRILAERKRLIGYGIPFRPQDERYLALRAMIERRGRDRLPWWRLHLALNDVVRRERKLPPNIATI